MNNVFAVGDLVVMDKDLRNPLNSDQVPRGSTGYIVSCDPILWTINFGILGVRYVLEPDEWRGLRRFHRAEAVK